MYILPFIKFIYQKFFMVNKLFRQCIVQMCGKCCVSVNTILAFLLVILGILLISSLPPPTFEMICIFLLIFVFNEKWRDIIVDFWRNH